LTTCYLRDFRGIQESTSKGAFYTVHFWARKKQNGFSVKLLVPEKLCNESLGFKSKTVFSKMRTQKLEMHSLTQWDHCTQLVSRKSIELIRDLNAF